MIRKLRSWLGGTTGNPSRSPGRDERRDRPNLQMLEVRDVPALFAVHLWSPVAGGMGDAGAAYWDR